MKAEPARSVVAAQREDNIAHFLKGSEVGAPLPEFNRVREIILALFGLTFVLMLYGVIARGWWMGQMSALFLGMAILTFFVAKFDASTKMDEDTFVDTFVNGARDLLGVALIIGVARGIVVIMDAGKITDTILNALAGTLAGFGDVLFINVMLVFQTILSFLVPSSSGLAVLTMPILAPLSDFAGRAARPDGDRLPVGERLGEPVQPDLRGGDGRAGDRAGVLRPLAALRLAAAGDPRGDHRRRAEPRGDGVGLAGRDAGAAAAKRRRTEPMATSATVAASGGLGLVACTALVVGNMIGSGIFLLPASLAAFGPISLVGWTVTSIGALVLAVIFGRLSRIVTKTGGPYAYTEAGFGEFAGFLIAWGYWIALWTGNAGVAVALAGYVGFLFPGVAASQSASLAVALIAIWTLTLVNIRGVAEAGVVQIVTTVLKLVPLALIGSLGFLWVDAANFTPFNTSGQSDLAAISAAAALTLWAYLGLEFRHRARRRRHRPRAHDPARHHPRRADRRRGLHLRDDRRDRGRAVRTARGLVGAARRRRDRDVGRAGRRARRRRRGDLDLRHAERLHAADRTGAVRRRAGPGVSPALRATSRATARRRTRWSSRTCSPRSSSR